MVNELPHRDDQNDHCQGGDPNTKIFQRGKVSDRLHDVTPKLSGLSLEERFGDLTWRSNAAQQRRTSERGRYIRSHVALAVWSAAVSAAFDLTTQTGVIACAYNELHRARYSSSIFPRGPCD